MIAITSENEASECYAFLLHIEQFPSSTRFEFAHTRINNVLSYETFAGWAVAIAISVCNRETTVARQFKNEFRMKIKDMIENKNHVLN